MVKIENISVSYNNKPLILKNLSCQINQGDFIVIVGSNGAGKSTFFDLLAGIIKPTTGSIIFNNKNIISMSQKERSTLVSILFQNPTLNSVSCMTVAQNFALMTYKKRTVGLQDGLKSFPTSFLNTLAEEWDIDFSDILDKPMGTLSEGQRQLVCFVMAMVVPPKLLLLDEPTASLDSNSATKLLCLVNKFVKKNGITTILITHDPYLALALGNKLWVLENGIIQRQYSAQEKHALRAHEIIGHINYEKLKESSAPDNRKLKNGGKSDKSNLILC